MQKNKNPQKQDKKQTKHGSKKSWKRLFIEWWHKPFILNCKLHPVPNIHGSKSFKVVCFLVQKNEGLLALEDNIVSQHKMVHPKLIKTRGLNMIFGGERTGGTGKIWWQLTFVQRLLPHEFIFYSIRGKLSYKEATHRCYTDKTYTKQGSSLVEKKDNSTEIYQLFCLPTMNWIPVDSKYIGRK